MKIAASILLYTCIVGIISMGAIALSPTYTERTNKLFKRIVIITCILIFLMLIVGISSGIDPIEALLFKY